MIKLIARVMPDTLHRKCPAEGWTVPAVAAHVALSPDFLIDRVRRIVAVEEFPPFDAVAFHGGNARVAHENVEFSSGQIIALLRDYGIRVAEFVRGLNSDDLDHSRPIPVIGDNPTPAEQFVERVLIGHTEEHWQSLRQCLTNPGSVRACHQRDSVSGEASTI